MQRATGIGKGNQRPWTDLTFGERAAFLPYDARSDALMACSVSVPPSFPCAEALGGVEPDA